MPRNPDREPEIRRGQSFRRRTQITAWVEPISRPSPAEAARIGRKIEEVLTEEVSITPEQRARFERESPPTEKNKPSTAPSDN